MTAGALHGYLNGGDVIAVPPPSQRVVIAGVPRSGKTRLAAVIAASLGLADEFVQHTDDLITCMDWSESSAEVARWFDGPAPSVIEGVSCVRALRKWLRANNTGKPCDTVYWLSEPKVAQSKGQQIMGKGCLTVWWEIANELAQRGVEMVEM